MKTQTPTQLINKIIYLAFVLGFVFVFSSKGVLNKDSITKNTKQAIVSTVSLNKSSQELFKSNTSIKSEVEVASNEIVAQADPVTDPQTCDPANAFKDYCDNDKNLLDNSSFENPICTAKPGVPGVDGQGCPATNDVATFYQQDRSILVPINSEVYYNEGAPNFQKPEVIVSLKAGQRQCEEQLTAHGDYYLKMFTRQGQSIDAGICFNLEKTIAAGTRLRAGVSYRSTQNALPKNPAAAKSVTLGIGYSRKIAHPEAPNINKADINQLDTVTHTREEYENGDLGRYVGGSISSTFEVGGSGMNSFCLTALSEANADGIDIFWDGMFVVEDSNDPNNTCDNATDHNDGVDRTCGGFECTVEKPFSASAKSDEEDIYLFDTPNHWDTTQCAFETETNGAESGSGQLYFGLDLNSCDPNYDDKNQRNFNPDFQGCDGAPARNWTAGYAWTGCVKDFALLNYLDCSVSPNPNGEGDISGSVDNPFFCNKTIAISQNITKSSNDINIDDGVFLRILNVYPGLIEARQSEGSKRNLKVPLLGSAIGAGVINFKETLLDESFFDPFMAGYRHSASGADSNYVVDFTDGELAKYFTFESSSFKESTVTKHEVLAEKTLSRGPVCANSVGGPITKFNWSDRAVFGLSEDDGTCEQIFDEANLVMSPEELCDSDLLGIFVQGEVVGANCSIGGETFNDDNINSTLEEAGVIQRSAIIPTINIPGVTPTPIYSYATKEICGKTWKHTNRMKEVYQTCRDLPGDESLIERVGGSPFVRWERPEGWRSFEIPGLNKLMQNAWRRENINAPYGIRHENVGVDMNYLVSGYDKQQPECNFAESEFGAANVPDYCKDPATGSTTKDRVCRRVPAYDEVGEDGYLPPQGGGISVGALGYDELLDQLEKAPSSYIKSHIKILDEPAEYDPQYDGKFLLGNTAGAGGSECTADGDHDGVSQVRIENYYPYVGQIARMNERYSVVLSNANDADTTSSLTNADLTEAEIREQGYKLRNEKIEVVELPFCDELRDNDAKLTKCQQEGESCDCYLRSCEEAQSMKKEKRLVASGYYNCKVLDNPDSVKKCQEFTRSNAESQYARIDSEYETCKGLPKTPDNYNCDPMADYLISQGFDDPNLARYACEYDYNQICEYDKFGVHLINGPVQSDKYDKLEKLGLKWKLEVSKRSFDNDPVQTSAIVQSINEFDGTSVIRFCNAAKDSAGNNIPDPDCDFSIANTGSSYKSGVEAAQTYLAVSRDTNKIFVASPVNEPETEKWAGLEFADVIEFYKGLFDTLETDPTNAARILVTSPTFNVTAGGNYGEFDTTSNEFKNSDVGSKIDIWSVNMYNGRSIGLNDSIEQQLTHVKSQLNDSKPIGINESGSFDIETIDTSLSALKASMDAIAGDTRVQYALLFNALGGAAPGQNTGGVEWSSLELSDDEFAYLLEENGNCVGASVCNAGVGSGSGGGTRSNEFNCFAGDGSFGQSLDCAANTLSNDVIAGKDLAQIIDEYGPYCDTETFAYSTGEAKPLPFGYNFALLYDSIISPGSPGGRNCSTKPPGEGVYYDPSDPGMDCPGFATRSQFPQYNFYRGAFKTSSCGLTADNLRWNSATSLGKDVEELTDYLWNNVNYSGFSLRKTSKDKVRQVVQKAKDRNLNPIILIGYWGTESWFGQNGASGGDNSGSSNTQCSDPGTSPGGYAGTCQEILDQVKREPLNANVDANTKIVIGDPSKPGLERPCTNASCVAICDMSFYPTLYCNKNTEVKCASCPVKETAHFRHELNHAVQPKLGPRLNEFMADAVSNNGGWYLFKHKSSSEWMLATDIVKLVSSRTGVSEDLIKRYFSGIAPSSGGINWASEIVDDCHMYGEISYGGYTFRDCPIKKTPPGLEAANCTNINPGDPPSNKTGIEIGRSSEGNPIYDYKFGNGRNHIALVGGMHGGYEWATIKLAYEMIDYYDANPDKIPSTVTLHIVPAVNVDGQKLVTGSTGRFTDPTSSRDSNRAGRFNGNGVDLNRNWGCNWQKNAKGPAAGGGIGPVNAGSEAFSEPETKALRDFFLGINTGDKLKAVVFWHNVANVILPAGCVIDGPLYPPSVDLSQLYGGYRVDLSTDNVLPYDVTGDASNWLEEIGVAATTVELGSDKNSEFSKNLPGVQRVIDKYDTGGGNPRPSPI